MRTYIHGAVRTIGGATLALLAACGGSDSTSPAPVDDVTLTLAIVSPIGPPLTLQENGKATLTIRLTASDGSDPGDVAVARWTSRATPVATVNASGLVTAAGVGQTYIVAEVATTKGVLRDSVRVDVTPAPIPQ